VVFYFISAKFKIIDKEEKFLEPHTAYGVSKKTKVLWEASGNVFVFLG
jgi:hypothetical protein